MNKKLALLTERKKVLRDLTAAQKSNNLEEVKRLKTEANKLLEDASNENESLTTEEVYGLMGD